MHGVGVAATALPDDDNNNNNQLLLQDLGIKRRRRNRILAAHNAFDAAIFQIQQDEDDETNMYIVQVKTIMALLNTTLDVNNVHVLTV